MERWVQVVPLTNGQLILQERVLRHARPRSHDDGNMSGLLAYQLAWICRDVDPRRTDAIGVARKTPTATLGVTVAVGVGPG